MAYKRMAKWDNQGEDEALDLNDFCKKYKDKLESWENGKCFAKMAIKAKIEAKLGA